MAKSLTINLTDSARAVVEHATRADRIVYSAYITEHGVTLDTVAEHVQALAALAVDLKRVDGSDAYAVKCFKNKVRNGLNSNLGKTSGERVPATALLTSLGVKATKEEVLAAWEAAQQD